MRAIIIDDERLARTELRKLLQDYPEVEVVDEAANADEGITKIDTLQPDLVFLDIQMPELTGIQFLKICGGKCKVILTTAYPEYALEGFDLDVVDYLLKPISYERFYKAATKAQQILMPVAPVQQEIVVQQVTQGNDFIFIKGDTKNKFIKVNYEDILYIEGLKNYVSVYTATQRIVTYQALRELETELPRPPFYRIHKSYIISIEKIKMIDGNTVYINDQAIPIGETYKEEFFKVVREGKKGG